MPLFSEQKIYESSYYNRWIRPNLVVVASLEDNVKNVLVELVLHKEVRGGHWLEHVDKKVVASNCSKKDWRRGACVIIIHWRYVIIIHCVTQNRTVNIVQ